ncbi:MAG: hypothetical protein ACTHO8_01595 [Solirubrobacterales bacterium]
MAGPVHGTAQCLHVGSFDAATTASALSQLAGVLAGFAFFAVIFILTSTAAAEHRSQSRKLAPADYDEALLTLFCATFGLAITAIQYAIIAGERNVGLRYGRAASEELMANISLSLSIFLLVAGMLLLVVPKVFGNTQTVVRILASVGGPPMTVYYIAETAREVAVGAWAGKSGLTLCGSNSLYSAVELWAHLIAPLLVLGIALSFWIVPRFLSTEQRRALEDMATRGRTAIPVATLFGVVIAVARGISLDEFHPHSHLGEGWIWGALAVASLLVLAQAFLLRFRPQATSPILLRG